jgi:hypothetical protein
VTPPKGASVAVDVKARGKKRAAEASTADIDAERDGGAANGNPYKRQAVAYDDT